MSTAAVRIVTEKKEDQATSLGFFYPQQNTISELIAAATAVERLGFTPEIKFIGNTNDPSAIELFTHDVSSMIGKLRASLTSTNHNGGSQG